MRHKLSSARCALGQPALSRSGNGKALVPSRVAGDVYTPVLAAHGAYNVSVSGVKVVGHPPSPSPERLMAIEVLGGAGVSLERMTVQGGLELQ